MAERIKIGDTIPSVTLKVLTDNGMEEVETGAFFAGKKALLFGVPGAFSPTCSAKHLPGFIEHAHDFEDKGIDLIACVAVNDPFVMKAWGEQSGVDEKIMLLPDGNADFTRALGLEMDASSMGLGVRSLRYAMMIEDGKVADIQVEEGGGLEYSSAECMLNRL